MIRFGPWLPDQPDIVTPGLSYLLNAVPVDGYYRPTYDSFGYGDAISGTCKGAFVGYDSTATSVIYAGDTTKLYKRNGTAWTDLSGTTYAVPSNGYWRFAQFNDTVIATNYADAPQKSTGSTFSDLNANAPDARQVGIIRSFVVLGDCTEGTYGTVPHSIWWSAIDDPDDWPLPGTADAASKQSSREELNAAYGPVKFIANGEQWGLVFQEKGIVRCTYVGGNTVFQFDTYERARGALTPGGNVQVGNDTYFISQDGFYVTNGLEVKPIGDGGIDRWFFKDFKTEYPERVTGAIDYENNLILWAYPGAGSSDGTPNKVIAYNYRDGRWGNFEEDLELIFDSRSQGYTLEQLDNVSTSIDTLSQSLDASQWVGGFPIVGVFKTNNKMGEFAGDPKEARFETAETEPTPMSRSYVSGIKPIISGASKGSSGGVPHLTVRVGTRDDQRDEVEWSELMGVHPRTRIADMRKDAYYFRARVRASNGFDKAVGLDFKATPSGEV